MTANQINYVNYLEKVRSDRENEYLKRDELYYRGAELEESKRRTDIQADIDRLSINSNVLNNIRSTEAQRYGANQSAGASIYSANVSRENTLSNIEADKELKASQVTQNKANTWTGIAGTALNAVKMVSSWIFDRK